LTVKQRQSKWSVEAAAGLADKPYVRVAVARPVQGLLTYGVPPEWLGTLRTGHVVLVPLGRRGAETGYVIDRVSEIDFDPSKVKPLSRVLDPEPAFTGDQLEFFRWIAGYYLMPLGLVIQTALPSQIRARVVSVLEPTELGINEMTASSEEGDSLQVLREIVSRPGLTRRGMIRRLDGELDKGEVERAMDRLLRAGWVRWGERELQEAKGRRKTVTLVVPRDQALELMPRAGRRMLSVLSTLEGAKGPVDLAQLVADQGQSVRDALRRMEDAGVVAFGEREVRDNLVDAPALGPTTPLALNPAQAEALDVLTAKDQSGTFCLHGVTGSGKTEVFLGTADAVLKRGKQVLVLVPEIGLTPQLVGRFRARFGPDVAVLHSGLTGHERLLQWRRIRAGEAPVAVGARSALFAPYQSLGLIVVDEEQDDSYKQDEGVPYSARDLAVVLGRRHNCPVVLASATPSLETWANAQRGRYSLLSLPERATARPLPAIQLVDMTEVTPVEGRRPVLAPEVEQALRNTFEEGGQAIVLYNRRGFATMVQCTSCGGTWECPNCGITMTLHRRAQVVSCHYCGLKRTYSEDCPSCGSRTLEELGKGTERIEEVLRLAFPTVSMERMDADTTAVRGSHYRILKSFREGKTRLLIGTQIVAKGHDFPGVHTAVVVSADHGFRIPDFRSAERTFSLLVQMAGRAGRGDTAGKVFVQTYNPEHYVLRRLEDPEDFYEHELRLRSMLRYPPYARLVLLRFDGVDRRRVQEVARNEKRRIEGFARSYEGVAVLGPTLAALPKLVGRWRFQVVIRGEQPGALRAYLQKVAGRWSLNPKKGVRMRWDVDPRHLM